MIRSILTSAGLVGHLDVVIDSGVVGVEKPDARIFGLALGEARVSAEEALYVGDMYSVDVLGARRAGLDPILLDPGLAGGVQLEIFGVCGDCRDRADSGKDPAA